MRRLLTSLFALAIAMVFIFTGGAMALDQRLSFFSLTRVDGLSNNDVISIAKDQKGYMWIGTVNGLSRYNSFDFKNYRYDAGELATLPGNHISCIHVDHSGRIWVGTSSKGLARYREASDDFVRYSLVTDVEHTSPDQVRRIIQDSRHVIWVATADGLFYYDASSDGFSRVPVREDSNKTFTTSGHEDLVTLSGDIPALAADDKGGVWVVYPDMRMSYLDQGAGKSWHYDSVVELGSPSGYTFVNKLIFHKGLLYMATRNQGLIVVDTESMTGKRLLGRAVLATATDVVVHDDVLWITGFDGVVQYGIHDSLLVMHSTRTGDPKSLSAAANNAIFVDDNDIVWIGSLNSGVNYANIRLPFLSMFEDQADDLMLSESRANALFHDSSDNLWVGYQSGHIEYFSARSKTRNGVGVQPLREDAGVGAIFHIYEDSMGDIYMGSWLGGLQKFNRNLNRFVPVELKGWSVKTANHMLEIRAIDEDDRGRLWLAMHGSGVVEYNTITGKVMHLKADPAEPHALSNEYIFDLRFDDNQHLWVVTAWGTNRLAPGDTLFTRYFASAETGSILSDNNQIIFKDSAGRMWFGGDQGLSLYNPLEDAFAIIEMGSLGLQDAIIRGMCEDTFGNLWVSSSIGIIRLDVTWEHEYEPVVHDFFVYDVNHGILSEDFFYRASSVDNSGHIYFGGTSGIDYFDPESYYPISVHAPLQLEEIRLFNRLVYPGSSAGPSVNRDGEAVFSHRENMLSFTYVLLDYAGFQRNDYYYRLTPLHEAWQSAGQNRNITFANLAPGSYVFSVKTGARATDPDDNLASFAFVIRAPFWKTTFFYLFAILFVFLCFIFVHMLWSANQRMKRLVLEREIRSRTGELAQKNEELHKLNQMKNKLFSIVSHDLRSPIANMMGLTNLIAEYYDKYDDQKRKQIINTLSKSAEKYFLLVDNLLQWSVSQSERIRVKQENLHLHEVTDDAYAILKSGFESKGIGFANEVSLDLQVYADAELVKIILRNLISNALKFTPAGGQVVVTANLQTNQMVRVDVSDTGLGMPTALAGELFSAEKTDASPGTEGESGTGLGLIICREFTEKMGGKIWVESSSPKGTTFSFTLPADSQQNTSVQSLS